MTTVAVCIASYVCGAVPHQAITFYPDLRTRRFTHEKLVLQLNHEGSRLETKK